jgi:hypothetical protein
MPFDISLRTTQCWTFNLRNAGKLEDVVVQETLADLNVCNEDSEKVVGVCGGAVTLYHLRQSNALTGGMTDR